MKNVLLDTINAININKGIEAFNEISDDNNLRTDLGLDSFDLAELTVRIEDILGIDIFEDGLVNTVGEILQKLDNGNGSLLH